MEINYTVVGIPKPQARPKVFHRTLKSGKPFVSTYSPKSDWFHLVYTESLKIKNTLKNRLVGALELNLTFCMPIPKSISKKKREQLHYVTTKTGDLDNLSKGCMDAMTQAGIWEDDCQVAILIASKTYSDEPRCEITIKQLEE